MSREITITEIPSDLNPDASLWLYNALDCAVTLEVWEALQEHRTPAANLSYNFVSAMRGPALEMMLRGIRIDMEQRGEAIRYYEKKRDRVDKILQQFALAVWDKPLNPFSSKQCKEFCYEAMKIPEVVSWKKGERKISIDRETLEKLEVYHYAKPIVRCILASREYEKKLQVLRQGLDEEQGGWRMRTSFNVVGTKFGRWSSSENAFGKGTNFQNVTDELRRMFVPDPGFKLGYFDLEQAESRAVAYISGDRNYIAACESGDLHTTSAGLLWSEIKTRAQADESFYRHFSYRDMSKKGGHGTNYYGTPFTMAKHLKVPKELMVEFQAKYFAAFPGIKEWHRSVAKQLQVHGWLTTALGRQVHFLGRRYDDTTLREAIACEPQSIVAELLNLWLYRVWKDLPQVQVLAQVHDAILLQYRKEEENEIVTKVLALAKTPVNFQSGTLVIPASAEVGWNWGKVKKDNPYGLAKYKGSDERSEPRTRGLLDRPIHTIL